MDTETTVTETANTTLLTCDLETAIELQRDAQGPGMECLIALARKGKRVNADALAAALAAAQREISCADFAFEIDLKLRAKPLRAIPAYRGRREREHHLERTLRTASYIVGEKRLFGARAAAAEIGSQVSTDDSGALWILLGPAAETSYLTRAPAKRGEEILGIAGCWYQIIRPLAPPRRSRGRRSAAKVAAA